MNKTQEAIILVLMAASFTFGYMFKKSQISVSTDTKDVTTQVEDNHTVITTVTHKERNGDLQVTKTIDSDVKVKKTDDKQISIQPAAKTWNVSALAGYDFSKPKDLVPIYGVSVSKQVLGPWSIGAFGLTNGIIGLSIGVTF